MKAVFLKEPYQKTSIEADLGTLKGPYIDLMGPFQATALSPSGTGYLWITVQDPPSLKREPSAPTNRKCLSN